MKKTKIVFIAIFFLLNFLSCKARIEEKDYYFVERVNLLQSDDAKLNLLSAKDSFPVFFAGTCSHHLLANKQIDQWFALLKKNRDTNKKSIKTFFILSPSHYGKSAQKISLTDKVWKLSSGEFLYNNEEISKRICSTLNVEFDREAFPGEHGVNTLIPFIKTYFPDAEIVPILVPETIVDSAIATELSNSLKPFFLDSKSNHPNTENFFLVSTDFSHHQDVKETCRRDKKSMIFFDNPILKNYIYAICDNRISIYVLLHIWNNSPYKLKTCLSENFNSYQLSGVETDVTSYFFSFFTLQRKE